MRPQAGYPTRRATGLVVKALGDEVLVYDLDRQRAHSLNAAAAAVWRQCDGRQAAAEIRRAVRATGVAISEEAVHYALGELGRARLLAEAVSARALSRLS